MEKVKFLDLQNEEENYLVCEACGKKMEGRSCKLKCGRCGYFRSCSDLF
jgi:tRNA(Ile2) C34 agmatinyltransferase TiaS